MALPLKKRKVTTLSGKVEALSKKVSRITPDKQVNLFSGTLSSTSAAYQEHLVDITGACLSSTNGDFIMDSVEFRVVPTDTSTITTMRTDVLVAKMDPTLGTPVTTATQQFTLPRVAKSYVSVDGNATVGNDNRGLMQGKCRTGLVVKVANGTITRNRHYLYVRYMQTGVTSPEIEYAVMVNFKEK